MEEVAERPPGAPAADRSAQDADGVERPGVVDRGAAPSFTSRARVSRTRGGNEHRGAAQDRAQQQPSRHSPPNTKRSRRRRAATATTWSAAILAVVALAGCGGGKSQARSSAAPATTSTLQAPTLPATGPATPQGPEIVYAR